MQHGGLSRFLHRDPDPHQVVPVGLHLLLQIQETPETLRDQAESRGHRGADQERPDSRARPGLRSSSQKYF